MLNDIIKICDLQINVQLFKRSMFRSRRENGEEWGEVVSHHYLNQTIFVQLPCKCGEPNDQMAALYAVIISSNTLGTSQEFSNNIYPTVIIRCGLDHSCSCGYCCPFCLHAAAAAAPALPPRCCHIQILGLLLLMMLVLFCCCCCPCCCWPCCCCPCCCCPCCCWPCCCWPCCCCPCCCWPCCCWPCCC